jgi:hypothetical protein
MIGWRSGEESTWCRSAVFSMNPDSVLFVAIAIIAVAMTVLGGHVSSSKRSQRVGFYTLGLLSIGLIVWQSIRSRASQVSSDNEQKTLRKQIQELAIATVDTNKGVREIAESLRPKLPASNRPGIAPTSPET